jgi:hypothetical protein
VTRKVPRVRDGMVIVVWKKDIVGLLCGVGAGVWVKRERKGKRMRGLKMLGKKARMKIERKRRVEVVVVGYGI